MREYNLNPTNEKYYRQNNNVIKPTIRCKPTGTVEGLDIACWPLPTGEYAQPEDNLTDFMEKEYGPDAPEDWDKIRMAINGHFLPGPKPIIGPRWDWDLQTVLFDITRGIPFVASTYLVRTGHVVNLVGFVTAYDPDFVSAKEIDISLITEFIIDDPNGDRTTGVYDTKKSGHNNRYPLPVFMKEIWRATGIQIRPNKKEG